MLNILSGRFALLRSAFLTICLISLSTITQADSAITKVSLVGAVDSPPVSYQEKGVVVGLIAELAEAIGHIDSTWSFEMKLYPWARGQWLVENGMADMFCTYPSSKRQEYAHFTETPAFIWQYGNLVFHRDNPNAEQIRQAHSFEDLNGLVFVAQHGSEWEEDNIPASIERVKVGSQEEALTVLLRRNVGDFLIMSPLEATFFARQNGYEATMAQAAVDFIPDSDLPFHFGISMKSDRAEKRIAEFEAILQSEAYQVLQQDIMKRYTDPNH